MHVRIRDAVGRLHLVDARQPGELMDEITAAGLDVDQGVVVKFEGIMYYGPEAVRILTLLSTSSGFFNRLSYWLFGSARRARIFYPICKAIRNVILKLLGIRYIENLSSKSKQEWRA
jgi:hypothetical protein